MYSQCLNQHHKNMKKTAIKLSVAMDDARFIRIEVHRNRLNVLLDGDCGSLDEFDDDLPDMGPECADSIMGGQEKKAYFKSIRNRAGHNRRAMARHESERKFNRMSHNNQHDFECAFPLD